MVNKEKKNNNNETTSHEFKLSTLLKRNVEITSYIFDD